MPIAARNFRNLQGRNALGATVSAVFALSRIECWVIGLIQNLDDNDLFHLARPLARRVAGRLW